MADSKSEAEDVQNEPGTSYCVRKRRRRAQKIMGMGQKGTGPPGQIWDSLSTIMSNNSTG